jgi:hypothetical protein
MKRANNSVGLYATEAEICTHVRTTQIQGGHPSGIPAKQGNASVEPIDGPRLTGANLGRPLGEIPTLSLVGRIGEKRHRYLALRR